MNIPAPKLKKPPPTFTHQAFSSADDQVEYLYDLFIIALHRRRQESAVLCMNELNDVFLELQIPLKVRQLHEMYLYGTFDKNETKMEAKQRVLTLVNNEKKKVDMKSVCKWLSENLKKGNIKLGRMRTSSNMETKVGKKVREVIKVDAKLPPIRGTSGEKLTEELKMLIDIFEEMQKERQNSGLIPINLDSDDQELDLTTTNIPYDPELYQLNNNLAKLRFKAEDRLSRIIELARDEPRVRMKLEEAIEKFQRMRIEANEKVGRIGSMKAQRRLLEGRRKEGERFRNLKLGEEEDLLRAARLYSLLSIQELKASKLVI